MANPKSRLGKKHIKKADLLRELDAVFNAVEEDLVTTSSDGSIVHANGDVKVGTLSPNHITGAFTNTWAITDWYIDGVVGSDSNSGTLASAPLQTGAELLRRVGPYAQWPQSVTIHVGVNGMIDALVLRGCMQVAGTHLDVIGTPTLLADAGTIATYAAVNHATPTGTQLTATGVADWTPYQWQRIRVTSGARINACTWIARSNPHGLGLATARVSPPQRVDTVSTSAAYVANSVFVAGDPIVIESLPIVPEVTLLIDGPVLSNAGSQYDRRQFAIQNIDTPLLNIIASGAALYGKTLIFGCAIQSFTTNAPVSTNNAQVIVNASVLYQSDPAYNGFLRWSGVAYNCLIGRGCTALYCGSLSSLTNITSQGASMLSSKNFVAINNMQVFDVSGATSSAINLELAQFNNISGNGNAGYGLNINNTAILRFLGTTNVQGAVSNAKLGSTPATPLTIPQALQPNDYAQKGVTPAMVAGTITVTVPWYDNNSQKVTVSHAVFAGTPGILSVQQTSTTQFTITSSSNLDTSTVNWQISPLGRNIHISAT